MNENKIVDTGLPMARIKSIRLVEPFRLEIKWAAGNRANRTDLIDVAPIIASYKVYRPLRQNPALFATAKVVDDGYAIAWQGVEAEMSAETLETCAQESMTADEFAHFIRRNSLTQEETALILGRSRRQLGYYLTGTPIPRVVALACYGYEAIMTMRRGRAA